MKRLIPLALAASLSACAADGSVDWGKVGDGALVGLVVLGAAAGGYAAAYNPPPQPVYVVPAYRPVSCTSMRISPNMATTSCY